MPSNVQAVTGAAGAINVSWSASTDNVGVTGYHVYRDAGTTPITTVTGTSYTDSGLTPGSSHSYTVSAFDAAGNESAQSSPASATAGSGSGGGTVTVGATDDATISQLAANKGTNYGSLGTLTVDGDQNINDFLMKFTVPAGCTPTAATLVLTVGSASTSGSSHGGLFYAAPGTWDEGSVTANNAPPVTGSPATLNAVTPGGTYPVSVTAQLAAATTGNTISLRATTTSTDAAIYVSRNASATAGPQLQLTCSGGGGGGGDPTPPSVPSNVQAVTGAAGAINVSWSASTDNVGVTGYHVYRDAGTTPITTVTGTSYTDSGLTPGSSHSYTVSAFDAAGNESAQSSPASATAGTGSGGGTVTVGATDDATISQLAANKGTNYGSLGTLTVDGDQNINDFLMKFTVPAGCTPTAATLVLTVGSASTSGSSHGGLFYAAPGTWDEGSVTANNAPPVTGSPATLNAVTPGGTYPVSVTAQLASATTGNTISLRATTTSTDAAIYVSRNASKAPPPAPNSNSPADCARWRRGAPSLPRRMPGAAHWCDRTGQESRSLSLGSSLTWSPSMNSFIDLTALLEETREHEHPQPGHPGIRPGRRQGRLHRATGPAAHR